MNKDLLNRLAYPGNRSLSKREFANLLGLDAFNYTNLDYLYEIDNHISNNSYEIQEAMKSLDKPIIPGSSLKGLIKNIIIYDILKTNTNLNNRFSNINTLLSKNNELVSEVKDLYRFLIVPDITVNTNLSIYTGYRTSKNRLIPIKNLETIPRGVESEVFNIQVDRGIDKIDLTNKSDYYCETAKWLMNFDNNFKKACYSFFKFVIKKEIESVLFIHFEDDISKYTYLKFLKQQDKALDEGHLILQIGKFTNFIDKSILHVFDNYNELFKEYKLRPKGKNQKPIIESINMIKINANADMPLGFIEIV